MIMRIWRTQVDVTRATEYERFATEQSLPMFRAHRGFSGLLFGRHGADCIVITLWEDDAAAIYRGLAALPGHRRSHQHHWIPGRPITDRAFHATRRRPARIAPPGVAQRRQAIPGVSADLTCLIALPNPA